MMNPSRKKESQLSVKHCAHAALRELPDAAHWLLHEEPEITSSEMIEFFGANKGRPSP